ncbi:ATP-dependent RecD-like DNA helicase [uncultured Anaerococcus sp.]|uniref:SF1B family DNA helicase RecD2 n=1 Tax=uncultured Anaerococcus sp. TaxID=293428 RepID=UPI00288A2D4F|nr:ATP-dependent RecD-like DNA helicase [uncultured Anaerococcus sp.]
MKLEGIVSNIRYRNDESGYSVMTLETPDSDITIVGTMPFFYEGDRIEVEGDFTYHDKYGEQINVKSVRLKKPSDKESIIKYLASGNIRGVGKKTAQAIYDIYGKDSLDILYKDPDKLLKVEGIGKKKLNDIKLSAEETRDSRRSLEFLQGLKISYNLAMKIYNKYGENTIDIVKSNPYKLIEDIKGIGFNMADALARNMQMETNSAFRISAGLTYVIGYESDFNGHTSLEMPYLVEEAAKLLKADKDMIGDQIQADLLAGKLELVEIDGKSYVYSKGLYKAEKSVAMALAKKIKEPYIFEVEIDENLAAYSDEQKEAIEAAFKNMLLVITGGPGTGKTTVINAITTILDKNELTYALAAPTGRAAKRMQEATACEANTIHRLVGIRPDMPIAEYNEENPIENDYIIVDEMSMVDIYLMKNFMEAVGDSTALIFVGDSDQLPSVGPGNVLSDILNSPAKSIRLKKIFRQAGESNIIVNAHRINEGKYPFLNQPNKDFFFIETSAYGFTKDLLNLIKDRLPSFYKFDPVKDIEVLALSRKTGWGVDAINKSIQEAINKEKIFLKVNDRTFKLYDKVMQVRNNYDLKALNNVPNNDGVYNGDIGIIIDIDTNEECIKVEFDDGKIVKYKKDDIKDLDLSYAITVHKSQGSEFKCVIIPMMQVAPMLLTRNLLYTGVTRAKKLVILLGEKRYIKRMVDNNRSNHRNSNLSYWINEMESILAD